MPWKWWNIPRWLCQLKIVKYTIDIHRLQCLNHPNWVHVFVASPLRAVAERPWPFRDRPLGFVWSQFFTRYINFDKHQVYQKIWFKTKTKETSSNMFEQRFNEISWFTEICWRLISPIFHDLKFTVPRCDETLQPPMCGLVGSLHLGVSWVLSHCMVLVGWFTPPKV